MPSTPRKKSIQVAPLENGVNSQSGNDDVSTGDHKVTSAVVGDCCHVFGAFFAILVRLVLVSASLFTVWLVVYKFNDIHYWAFVGPVALLIIEGIYTVYTRRGQERKWICWCFFFYLLSTIPPIWVLELDKLEHYDDEVSNYTHLQTDVAGTNVDIKVKPDTLIALTEQILLFLLILCRWLLPRGDITRDQLSQLLFVFIGMASDVMELFELFEEDVIRKDKVLTYIILGVWSLSLFQFTLVLTMSHNPKKVRAPGGGQDARIQRASLCNVLIHTEIWSLFVTIFMQDGPFLGVRLYSLLKHDLMTYGIIFYTCKNSLVILLLMYRFMVLIMKRSEENDDYDDDDKPVPAQGYGAVVVNNSSPVKDPFQPNVENW